MAKSRPKQAAPLLLGLFMNLPPLRDEHTRQTGYYLGAVMEDSEKPWRGFALYESFSDSTGYEKRGEYALRATVGIISTLPLTSSSIDYRIIDRASTIKAELMHRDYELQSVTEDEMLAGRNRFLVGKEIVGAANAKLISADATTGLKTYELSTLLRGVKDTFTNMDTHQANELLVWLDGPGIYFVPHTLSKVGGSVYLKAVAGGGTIVEAFPFLFTPLGETVKPFRPLSIVGTRDGSNNLTITWERQTRHSAQLIQQGTPFNEEREQYKVQVLQTSGSELVVREVVVADVRTWTYTAAHQSTDSKVPGEPVPIIVTQMSMLIQDSGNSSPVTV